jgi:uncharacterized protein YecE (DUF72 family)
MQRVAERATGTRLEQISVKVPGTLTHDRPESRAEMRSTVSQYLQGIEPIRAAGLFAGSLVQFPYSFHYLPDNRRYLASLADELHRPDPGPSSTPLFVEFRNAEWYRESVEREMRSRGLIPVGVDLPGLDRLPPKVSAERVRGREIAYLRFHGRNARHWWGGTNVTRYDYLYSQAEIDSLASSIEQIRADELVQLVFVAFNNHFRGQAVANAQMLARRLGAVDGETPEDYSSG